MKTSAIPFVCLQDGFNPGKYCFSQNQLISLLLASIKHHGYY